MPLYFFKDKAIRGQPERKMTGHWAREKGVTEERDNRHPERREKSL